MRAQDRVRGILRTYIRRRTAGTTALAPGEERDVEMA
jgi:hypothetical protein